MYMLLVAKGTLLALFHEWGGWLEKKRHAGFMEL